MKKDNLLQTLNHQESFAQRHIGLDAKVQQEMLLTLDYSSMAEFLKDVLPEPIRLTQPLKLPDALSERDALTKLNRLAEKNELYRSLIGHGYYGTELPYVISRNVLENPSWYTAYTPYQAEISQGRMTSLLNFQQVTLDLTGLDVACASLLDEATAAAEAMGLAFRMRKDKSNVCFFVADDLFPQTIAVVQTRALHLGIDCVVAPLDSITKHQPFGLLLQQSNAQGELVAIEPHLKQAQAQGMITAVACDWMALMLLRSPGELGADIAFGSSQRFGVPMGFGGPHAAFFAAKDKFKRSMPGRMIGVSRDSRCQPALRMAMQTREQHIRRDKASSNICTAQVLLANLAAFYAVYHGAEGLKKIAWRIHELTNLLVAGLQAKQVQIINQRWFDTITFSVREPEQVIQRAHAHKINLRQDAQGLLGLSLDECSTVSEVTQLWDVILGPGHGLQVDALVDVVAAMQSLPVAWRRQDAVLTHPNFKNYHTETEMLRYIHHLERQDLALNQAMIPLGSCTMKLNATSQMLPIQWPEFANMHPFCPPEQAKGYLEMIQELSDWLCQITGFDAISMQPNSGAQGEYAGLLVIQAYLAHQGQEQRHICLIPDSAHGTNPASASMAGMRVVGVACDVQGNIDVADLHAKIATHQAHLACLMITYPSTHGVFESEVQAICAAVHAAGGQVYMDGANMNAQVGLTSPAHIGADVTHLNLHKTFAIPHGGGGPGMGPIGVRAHLQPFLPNHRHQLSSTPSEVDFSVSAAPLGSAGILPISWMYLATLGRDGVQAATESAILSANYICAQLAPHYDILYTGHAGRVAHEGIIDLRPFKASAGISELDVAKRLIDYGFHAPTMSFPVSGTLMIEPTESESKVEIDAFIDAMISIREEIKQVELGRWPQDNNPLVHAPHTMADLIETDFEQRGYSRQVAAFPSARVRRHKIWPKVNRLDDVYGDRNFCCACPE
jgi:glycine dehydrogenase